LPPGLLVSSYACYRPAASVLGINDAAGWLLAVVIGVCAVFWAMKSQLSSVIERRKEIGILKAMGWTDGNVVGLILLESLMQALAGGVLGCIVAVVLLVFVPFASLGNIRTPATVSISLGVLVAGSALALLGGVIAGGFPALKAASLRPADALRKF
jgi:putative ABC transport system permease protein